MFLTYLRRELGNRRKQTVVVAVGLALAVALVVVVSSVSAGVQAAQTTVLASVYGVGTDITVTQPGERGAGGPGRFDVGAEDGATDEDGSRTFSQDRLAVSPRRHLRRLGARRRRRARPRHRRRRDAGAEQHLVRRRDARPVADGSGRPPRTGRAATGGRGGRGGRQRLRGRLVQRDGRRPDGRRGRPAHHRRAGRRSHARRGRRGAEVAVADATYAQTNELAVGDTVSVGGTDVEIVGTVTSTTGDGVATASDVYVPLALAQSLADLDGQVSDLYVQADSASEIDAVADAITDALPDATVSTQSDLASSVTGSLSTASSLVSSSGRGCPPWC
ncbi:ABC transporter permease [Cellulosimicrobium sp. CUA-896]|uniref:ABC transporter permease n=1 Tax=Cellulosimicrobium sp. CUA-896 TaxID=1517881 RepID=UPI0021011507|nr:ABC transporter permease [Cellulosimicrobium sp. CUA-896]